MIKKLEQTVENYNSTYNTSFSVLNTFSFGRPEVEPLPDDRNPYPNKGGVYLFYDNEMNVLAVYSANDFHTSLKGKLKDKKDVSGNWAFKGQGWNPKPTYVAFIECDQDKMYEKDSLRSYLIEKLHSRLDEHGILVW